jgi:hypothetical protein
MHKSPSTTPAAFLGGGATIASIRGHERWMLSVCANKQSGNRARKMGNSVRFINY